MTASRICGSGAQAIASVAYAVHAVEPDFLVIGPIPAVPQALERVGWSIGDVQRVEINEAFAAIALAITREPEDFVKGIALAFEVMR